MKSRRAFLTASGGAFASIAALRFPAGAAEFSYKLAHDRPAADPVGIALAAAATKVLNESSGRFEIKVFANNSLGGDAKMLSAVREGAVEIALMVDVVTANIAPSASLSAVGFAFADFKAAYAAMDGSFGNYIRDQIQQQAGVYSFGTVWDGGFKQISNSLRPINGPDDLKGLKIRVPPGPISVSLYKSLGAAPVALEQNEQYTSAQTHLIDGSDTSASLLLTSKLYEVQKYLAITNHSFIAWHLLANNAAWQGLPKNLRELADHTFDAASKTQRANEAKEFEETLAALHGHGLIVSQPEPTPFRNALRAGGYYAFWKDKFGTQAWGSLEKLVGRLS